MEELKTLNAQRKSIQDRIFERAREAIRADDSQDLFLIYDAGNGHEGVMGIVAGKLKEEFYRPVIIVTDTEEEGIVKGTGRSVEGIDLHQIMSRCSHLYIKFGGHAGACGFSMKRENLAELRRSLNESVRCLVSEDPQLLHYQLNWDAEISSADVTLDFAMQIAKLEPFGEGNPQPVFLIRDVLVKSVMRMGGSGQYLKLRCEGEGGTLFDAVWFDVEEEIVGTLNPGCGGPADRVFGYQRMEGKKFGSVYDPRYTGVVSFSRPAHPGGAKSFAEYLKKAAAILPLQNLWKEYCRTNPAGILSFSLCCSIIL